MKLRIVLALVMLMGKGMSQEAGKEAAAPAAVGKNPFVMGDLFLSAEREQPLMLYSVDAGLWELANNVASEPPRYGPGVGIGVGSPVAILSVWKPEGRSEPGFKISIYTRVDGEETGLMGISRVTAPEEHVTEERYLGWFIHKELRTRCEAEGLRELAKQAGKKPLQWFSMIGPKEGAPGVWVEKVYGVNTSPQQIVIEDVKFVVEKAGTKEEVRKAGVTWPAGMKDTGGKKQFKLLPWQSWLAVSTEWNGVPDLTSQSGSVWVKADGSAATSIFGNGAEVSRYLEAKVEGE